MNGGLHVNMPHSFLFYAELSFFFFFFFPTFGFLWLHHTSEDLSPVCRLVG